MKKFLLRASSKISKLSTEQIEQIIKNVAETNHIYASIFNSLNVAMIICDKYWNVQETNTAGELYINQNVSQTDLKNSDVHQEKKVWELIHEKEIARFVKSCGERNVLSEVKELTLQREQDACELKISIVPIYNGTEHLGIIINIEDVTEEKNNELLLRRMESMANYAALGANVAHEIKNPLGSMSIYVQLIQKTLNKMKEEGSLVTEENHLDKYLSIINEEIERINKIVVDLLVSVRPVKAGLVSTDISVLLANLADFFNPEFEKLGISLHYDVQFKKGELFLPMDEKLFKQIMMNLVKNAIAAMPEGGTFSVIARVASKKLLIVLEDTGTGIDNKNLQNIFDPFFTTKSNGNGLGLTIVYKLVKELHGEIEVKSEVGKGTRFVLSFPLEDFSYALLEYTEGEK